MFTSGLGLNRAILGARVFRAFFSFDFRCVPGGPPEALFGPPGEPKIASSSELSLLLASESLPERFRGARGSLRDPFWGPKREVPTLTIVWFFSSETHFSNFQRGSRKKHGKTRKSRLTLMRFWPTRVLEGLQKFVFSDHFFQRFFLPHFYLFLGPRGGR